MRKTWLLLFVLHVVVIFIACDDVAPLVFAPEDFLGKWNALKDEFANKNNAFQKVDILTSTNTDSVTLTFSESSLTRETSLNNGGFTFSIYSYEVHGDTLAVSTFEDEIIYKFVYERTFAGNTAMNVLRLTNENATYDFDDDGTPEAATEILELERL